MDRSDRMAEVAEVARLFAVLPGVRAVALGGSTATGRGDAASDADLYVYADAPVDPDLRAAIILPRAVRAEIDNRFWEWGDEWEERVSGHRFDVMFRSPAWIEEQLARVLDRHEASIGYSTCLWHNVLTCRPLEDGTGWLAGLKAQADQPYPDGLARAVIAKNHPLLRGTLSSFETQLLRALERGDPVAANHRAAALLASYFDVIFALNRQPHPGEKRLLDAAASLPAIPVNLRRDVTTFLRATVTGEGAREAVTALLEGLDAALAGRGELPPAHGHHDGSVDHSGQCAPGA
ncbi:MAG TPA: nucleotidyltransferase domain-containing protein [Azospirillaceae bacterium]|nr:nucleotidyltransferase domain-containing protein [Azospirillaceae bacterium]